MKKKKLTYNELGERLDFVFEEMVKGHRMIDYLNMLLVNYIKFSENEDKFKKFLEKELNKDGQNGTSSIGSDRKDKSGDTADIKETGNPGKQTSNQEKVAKIS